MVPIRATIRRRKRRAFRVCKFEPQAYTLYSYAGVQIINGRRKPKSLDPKKVAEKMHPA